MAELSSTYEAIEHELANCSKAALCSDNILTSKLRELGNQVAQIYYDAGHLRKSFGGSREGPSDDRRSQAVHSLFSHILRIGSESPQLLIDGHPVTQGLDHSNDRDRVWCLLRAASLECGKPSYVENIHTQSRDFILPAKWMILRFAGLMNDAFHSVSGNISLNHNHPVTRFASEFANIEPVFGQQQYAQLCLAKDRVDNIHRTAMQIRATLTGIKGSWKPLRLNEELKTTAGLFSELEDYVRIIAGMMKPAKPAKSAKMVPLPRMHQAYAPL